LWVQNLLGACVKSLISGYLALPFGNQVAPSILLVRNLFTHT